MPDTTPSRRPLPIRLVVGFGRFWWDFLVGDTPELFLGMVVVLGMSLALVELGGRAYAWIVLPLAVVDVVAMSAFKASRKTGSQA